MLNYIWGSMILISVVSAIITGRVDVLSNSVFEGTKDAINLSISLLGMMCFWSGFMKIAEQCGMDKSMSRLLAPILKFLFPEQEKGSKALNAICMNISANILGLGNAATPLGIIAMKELNKENKHSRTASNSMITFVVVNTASLQLVPTFMSIIRKSHGSNCPFDVLPCIWITSVSALIFGILISKLLEKVRGRDE